MKSPRKFIPINIAVLTVSDTRSATEDVSGDLLSQRILSAGHFVASRSLVPDEKDQIVRKLESWIFDRGIDVILSTGGTGLTGRDVTVEAHKELYEKDEWCALMELEHQ